MTMRTDWCSDTFNLAAGVLAASLPIPEPLLLGGFCPNRLISSRFGRTYHHNAPVGAR
jgi:hypothetical protein